MRRKRFIVALSVAVLFGCFGCAAPSSTDDSRSSESAIVNGVATEDYPAVGRLRFGNDTDGWWSCTATLIRPRVILTAAHCVTGTPNAGIEVVFGGKKYFADEWVWSGTYRDDGRLADSYDWAIARLTEDVEGIEWMRMTVDLPPRSTWFTALGFGRDENGQSGTKKSAAAWITYRYDAYFEARAASTRYEGAGWASICNGDSGGPAIDADGRVFGIVSTGTKNCDGSFRYTRVSIEWNAIHDQIGAWGQ